MSNLDQIRTRLMTLNASIRKLQENIATQNPLPSWSTLQTHTNLITNNLQSIAEQLAEHQQVLGSTETFPLPQFPGRQQEVILQTLLRSKLEPNAEEWVEQGQRIANDDSSTAKLTDSDRDELWQWAPSAANTEARKQKWGADYTLAEKLEGVERVITGLNRELVEPADDVDDEEDDYDDASDEEDEEVDKMDSEQVKSGLSAGSTGTSQQSVNRPQMSLSALHRFMTTGRVG